MKLKNWKLLTAFLAFMAMGMPNSTIAQDKEKPIKIEASTSFARDYYAPIVGLVVGSGPVNQSIASITFKNLSAFVWSNYDLTDKKMHEVDAGINYTQPIKENLSLTAGYQHWFYPSGLLGDYDDVVEVGVNYEGPINLSLSAKHLLAHGNVSSGQTVSLATSKRFPISKKGKTKISADLGIQTAALDHFYRIQGIPFITPGIGLNFKKGLFNLNLSLEQQISLSKNPNIPNYTQYRITASKEF